MDLADKVLNELRLQWRTDPTMGQVILSPDRIERVGGPTMTQVKDTDRFDWMVVILISLFGKFLES
jgi:hypothetical protein